MIQNWSSSSSSSEDNINKKKIMKSINKRKEKKNNKMDEQHIKSRICNNIEEENVNAFKNIPIEMDEFRAVCLHFICSDKFIWPMHLNDIIRGIKQEYKQS